MEMMSGVRKYLQIIDNGRTTTACTVLISSPFHPAVSKAKQVVSKCAPTTDKNSK